MGRAKKDLRKERGGSLEPLEGGGRGVKQGAVVTGQSKGLV